MSNNKNEKTEDTEDLREPSRNLNFNSDIFTQPLLNEVILSDTGHVVKQLPSERVETLRASRMSFNN